MGVLLSRWSLLPVSSCTLSEFLFWLYTSFDYYIYIPLMKFLGPCFSFFLGSIKQLLASFANYSTYYFGFISLDKLLPKKCFLLYLHFGNQIKFVLIQDFVSSCFYVLLSTWVIYGVPRYSGTEQKKVGNHCPQRVTVAVVFSTFLQAQAEKDNSHHLGF